MGKSGGTSLYARGAAATIAGKGLFYLAAFGSLWFATRILPKPDYAAYAFAVSAIWLSGIIATAGLDQALLMFVARNRATLADDGAAQVRGVLLAVLGTSGAAALALALAAPVIARVVPLPDLVFWLRGLAAMLVLMALSAVLEAWNVARGRVWISQIYPAIGQAVRLPLLAVVLTVGGGAVAMVAVELLVFMTPVLLFLRHGPGAGALASVAGLWQNGATLMTARSASEGVRRIDLYMLGALANAVLVAEYAVAARFAALMDVGRELMQPAFTSRAGRLIESGDTAGLRREFDDVRSLSTLMSLGIGMAIMAGAMPVLALFGDFTGAYAPLMVLIAGSLINVASGSNNLLLNLAGHARFVLLVRLSMLALMIVIDLALIPRFGAMGAALGMAIVSLVSNLLFFWALWRRVGVMTLDWRTVLVTILAMAVCALAALALVTPLAGGGVMVAIIGLQMLIAPACWRLPLAELRRLRLSRR